MAGCTSNRPAARLTPPSRLRSGILTVSVLHMSRRLFFLLCCLLAALLPARAAEPSPGAVDQEKLVGRWRYEDQANSMTAKYEFRQDRTFTAELVQGGEVTRKFEGRWAINEGMIVYTYEKDSINQVQGGARERDRLIRIDDSSYTIEGGDRGQRTYWREKEPAGKPEPKPQN